MQLGQRYWRKKKAGRDERREGEMSMKFKKEDLLLYAVTDRRWLNGETLYSQVEKAVKGGASFIQLREKELDKEQFLEEAKQIGKLCKHLGVPFVIDDDVEIAVGSDADGVHVGQNDMDICLVREKLGPDKIIGATVHTVEEALLAEAKGADYLGTGSAFSTGTKRDAKLLSHEIIGDICDAVEIPVIAIGGIDKNNVGKLQGRGLCGVAVISAVFGQTDIETAARELKEQISKCKVLG